MQVIPHWALSAARCARATKSWADLPEPGQLRVFTMACLTTGVRATGAYSTRASGLLAETTAILHALQAGAVPAEIRTAVLAGRLLHERARLTSEDIIKRRALRLVYHGQPWIWRGPLSQASRIASTPNKSRARTCANLCSGTGAIP